MPESVENTPLAEDQAADATALVIIDMLSDWNFPDDDMLLPEAEAIAPVIAKLKTRCAAAGVPTIYANDNYGRWRSNIWQVVNSATGETSRGRKIGTALAPNPNDYFVLKPKHSAFHATPLDLLLRHLGVERLLLTGVTTDQCVLYTAVDARMHDYQVTVPQDTTASLSVERTHAALRHLEAVLGGSIQFSETINLPATG